MSVLNTERNPYAPSHALVLDSDSTHRIKPGMVKWALTALWLSYGLSFMHAAIVLQERLILWPPSRVVLSQLAQERFYAAMISFISSGRNQARIIYSVLCVQFPTERAG